MRILLLCWRDTGHPQGGGSERYLERVGTYLATQHGHQVILRSAAYAGAPRHERGAKNGGALVLDRAGGRLTVYPWAWVALFRGRLGRWLNMGLRHCRVPAARARGISELVGGRYTFIDAIVDTQNGIPFFARLVSGVPTVILTHHCHREQWPVAGRVLGRLGWWLESVASPRLHRRCRYVTVSTPSAQELVELGVQKDAITIIRNGLDELPSPTQGPGPGPRPYRLVTLSRLVPHKNIEDALFTLRRLVRDRGLDVTLDVVGSGWWEQELRTRARQLGLLEGNVRFHGHVSEERKHALLAGADVHLMPSTKEGWGLAVMEAAQHGVPTVGYRSSRGLTDSIDDGRSGILVDSLDEFVSAVLHLLTHPEARRALGRRARVKAQQFSWEATGRQWQELLVELTSPPPAERTRDRHE